MSNISNSTVLKPDSGSESKPLKLSTPDELHRMADVLSESSTVISKSNLEISRSILSSSTIILTGLHQIANEMERKTQLDEYYMLTKEIASFEDLLIEMGVFQEAYNSMTLKEIPEIEFSESDCMFLSKIIPNSDTFNIISSLILTSSSNSPIDIILDMLKSSNTHTISLSMEYTNDLANGGDTVQSISKVKCNLQEIGLSLPISIDDFCSSSEYLSLRIGDNLYTCYLYNSPISNGEHLLSGFFRDMHDFSIRGLYALVEPLWEHEIDKILGNADPRSRNHKFADSKDYLISKATIQDKINKILSRIYIKEIKSTDIIKLLEKCKESNTYSCSLSDYANIIKLKSFVQSMNFNIKISNLRLLHSELRNAVIKYKLEKMESK